MKKFSIIALSLAVLFLTVGLAVAAKPDFRDRDNKTQANNQGKATAIPAHAVRVAPDLYYLGETIHKGKRAEGYVRVHYKKGYGKPTCNNNGTCEPGEKKNCPDCKSGDEEPDTSSCYGYTRGLKWKSVEPYIVDPTNHGGLDEEFVRNNLSFNISKWEQAAGGIEIIGDEVTGIVDGYDDVSPDDKNEVMFADILEEGVIAFNIAWRYMGNPRSREIFEWDQVYDDTDHDWSDTGEAGKMDFENIATHELGHAIGLGDIVSSDCTEITMYGYAAPGETKKRSLEGGDISGAAKLYR